ncbi:phage endolysin [Escherichia coli]|nr:phage endolysin [Escherichia coli]
MVEINNQRKAFLDMLAWSEGTDNGRQKTRNHGYDVIVGGELFTDYSDHPRKLVTLNPKTQINRRRTLPASFPLVGCLPQAAWPERLLSEKSGRCGIAAD